LPENPILFILTVVLFLLKYKNLAGFNGARFVACPDVFYRE